MRRFLNILSVALLALLLAGCAGKVPDNVASIGGNLSTDGTTWSAGFVVTFKDAIPADVEKSLLDAGAEQNAPHEFTFRSVRAVNDPTRMKAVAAAGGSGVPFTITPLK